MSKIIDMTNWDMREHGQPDSYIKVLGNYHRKNNHTYWDCECLRCGKKFEAEGYGIRIGRTKTCGCSIDKAARDLKGKRFGNLTVLDRDNNYYENNNIKQKLIYWKCQCDCGKIITTTGHNLRTNHTTSCGCLSKEKRRLVNAEKFQGQTYGLLTVIKQITIASSGHAPLWEFKCICGRVKYAYMNEVTSGKISGCGYCKNSMSIGERIIGDLLTNNNIKFLHDKTIDDPALKTGGAPLRYDFLILNEAKEIIRLIEFDGQQHYIPVERFGGQEQFLIRRQNDKIKNQYAISHSIPLVRIPYWERDKITLEMLMGDQYLVQSDESFS